MNVVVVESPAKAKTINKYLGSDYQVLASYGHVRDLPSKDGSVEPEADFAMTWEVDERGEKRIKDIVQAVKKADRLILATDPDREGEAISWHILKELERRRALSGKQVQRVAFNAVTKEAVLQAFSQPRDLNQELIEAYLARRALDYLVGFTLSPVLWRKLPGSRSAGRVQSVALRLICEREAEIEAFRPREYWSVDALLATTSGEAFLARLTHLDGKKLDKFSLSNEAEAKAAVAAVEGARAFRVESVERKQTRRNPQPPFTTSTLQQEASRKLGFGASKTMRIAQRLYEGVALEGETVGLITYMRTDGVQVSPEAIGQLRGEIGKRFGDRYLPKSPRAYATKAKNAQEAHEAIRPTDIRRDPQTVKRFLDDEGRKLYELIWKRTLASQMESAVLDQVAAEIAADDGRSRLRATGSTLVFDGFYTLYREGRDEEKDGEEDDERRLPQLAESQDLNRREVRSEQHFTQPPPRYSEASLVKRLEELGIGRPSTYASIIQVLQDRDYVRIDKRRFVPEDRGRVVTVFLTSFFDRYVQYGFTAELENSLDEISAGKIDWRKVLRDFWQAFSKAVEETKGLSITEVIDALDAELGPHFFPSNPDKPDLDPRACPSCGDGRLGLRLGRTGGFVGCSNYPDCRYTRPLGPVLPGEQDSLEVGPRELGQDPETGLAVALKKGPYGLYIQLGPDGKGEDKPKRVSLPKNENPDEITLERALGYLSLPREVCQHPDDGKTVTAGIGRFGPYIRHADRYVSLPADEDVLAVGANRAMAILAEAPAKKTRAPQIEVGKHPKDGKPITAGRGRFGPYVKHGTTFATLPKGTEPEAATLEQAVELLNAKAATKGKKVPAKKAEGEAAKAKKAPAKKTAAKKATTQKTTKKAPAKSKKKAAAS